MNDVKIVLRNLDNGMFVHSYVLHKNQTYSLLYDANKKYKFDIDSEYFIKNVLLKDENIDNFEILYATKE